METEKERQGIAVVTRAASLKEYTVDGRVESTSTHPIQVLTVTATGSTITHLHCTYYTVGCTPSTATIAVGEMPKPRSPERFANLDLEEVEDVDSGPPVLEDRFKRLELD